MIKLLDKSVSDKIAAGEVIERPISIVKELVENAVDAGADSIVVEIKNGGKSYIRVTDNGCGIPCEEAETAFLRHATSKIETAIDLNSIETLGFRGEALASVVAVTRTELITKTTDNKTGTRLVIHGGMVIANEQTGCPDGTTIVVTDLFYNTPARLKFMKTDSAESGLIIDFMSQMALAYKNIKFRLINNGKILFSTLGDGNRLNTILRVYSDVDARNMVPLNFREGGLYAEGYISTPAFSKTTRSSQIYFVNGRVVSSKVIERGVSDGYKERLFEGRYPVVYLFLQVDPHTIDVNIHPNKREVRFDEEALIINFISRAIKTSLSTKEAIVDAGNIFKDTDRKISPSKVYERVFMPFREKTEKNAYEKTVEKQVDIKQLLSTVENPVSSVYSEPIVEPVLDIYRPQLKPFDFSELQVTGVIFDTYITAVDGLNFYLFDQHAAHERIFYERLVGEYKSVVKERQPLLIPLIINLSLAVSENRFDWSDALSKMGFTIEEFGPGTFRITEIPMFMEMSEAEDFINKFIENINNSTDLSNRIVIDKLIMMSCKAAVKANDKLNSEEVNTLIKDLSYCVNPFSCPHGRPTFIKLTRYEIEKMFKRV
ncbi:MAG: DNA mismatch repair endonuclease MutL [Anaerovoracaceae bacterium]